MNVRRGDVVLVAFPFSSGGGQKRRPALVVQNDRSNQRTANTILVAITSNTRRAGEPTQLEVDPQSADGKASGLLLRSVVTCENLITIERALIARKIGALSATAMSEVDECLRASLGLS